ncbi:MAG TPA: hypothetical protein VMH41_16320 [Mycobacteriales bacterium]|nr:hypothetical protein [Mycobacteriales bacterium]
MLGLHFVPLDDLGGHLRTCEFGDYRWMMQRAAFAYCSAELTN